MSQNLFVDTNIFLYRVLKNIKDDPEDFARKKKIATKVTEFENIFISTQVVNEVSANLIKKANFKEVDIRRFTDSLYKHYQIIQIDYDVFLEASHLREKYYFSYWDSLIIASALKVNVELLYSEDMHHGLVVDNQLTIINPFEPSSKL
ncbi:MULTISPECIES: PIN domain-containing protein [Cyanophyceae]|uniref:PIN domain-containing protein n=1 Tax=Cyanophyceae TaxID=3028117 RepID=UPI00016DCB67|nr:MULTISPECIES: PIN domain-containing protein [Cyanophyceae]ACB00295.1 PIN domain protein [Picosynechococcus sp. PCC 7002]SMH52567.1 Predicted nucleic acid-binding protein, contains PIN domain [Picosynechococcus sp. OG1]SMQ82341.1 Predicted nucleic acid-binding protein, contains PIN domain [Synechococcus sp. 7002]